MLAGCLGARALELQNINWQQLPQDDAITPGCRFFRETGLNLCQPFLGYWERNGGLERFGYPLTRVRQETLEGKEYSVQYFERDLVQLAPGDLPAAVQQLILDLAYDSLRSSYPQGKLAVGLIDVAGDYAAALAKPFGQRPIFVYLAKQGDLWQVIESSARPSAERLRQLGIPDRLQAASDAYTIIDLSLAQLQDERG